MPTTADFQTAALYMAAATLVFGLITLLSFVLKWGFRFRLVGVTGFSIVLTVGLFALGLVPFTRETVPGAVRYSTVYDSGSVLVAIAVSPTITEEQMEATLKQVSSDFFSPGRLSRSGNQLTIRARAIVHPEKGISEPLYLGQVRRSLFERNDENMEITVYSKNFAKLPKPAELPAS